MVSHIIVTGTPGTGKTTVAKILSKLLGLKYFNINEFKFKDQMNINPRELQTKLTELAENAKETLVIDSHLSHHLPPKFTRICIITHCNITELQARLIKRGYSEVKIRENIDSEIFNICKEEAVKMDHNIQEISTDCPIDLDKLTSACSAGTA